MSQRFVELERQSWLATKAAGKTRFTLRQMLYQVVFGLILMFLFDWFSFKTSLFSLQNIVIDLVLLPLFPLCGYLKAKWEWSDLEKKYPADSLPPAE